VDYRSISRAAQLAGFPLDPTMDVAITGNDPIFESPFYLGEGAAVAVLLTGLAANRLWTLRGGVPQKVWTDVPQAAASLLSFVFLSVDGIDVPAYAPTSLTDFYPCQGARWIHLHESFGQAPLVLDALDLPADAGAAAIRDATLRRDAFKLEDELARKRLCGAVVRTATEWENSAQGRWLSVRPAVEIVRIGPAPPEAIPVGPRPLSGIRVLDLTRLLAGPTCTRTLAEHGADVLHVASPQLPTIQRFELDTGHGKRQTYLELNCAENVDTLLQLVREGDIFCQSYRPGALARRGFGPEQLARLRPGVVYVSVNCYGGAGPWGDRPGWEQLAQAATGIASITGGGVPRLVPAAFNDYTTGYLAAAGVMEALYRRTLEGGSWHVQVSLCQTSMWYQSLGHTLDPRQAKRLGNLRSLLQKRATPQGDMTFLGPSLRMSETTPHWELPSAPPGIHSPTWLPRLRL
jgi:hypothetical protein